MVRIFPKEGNFTYSDQTQQKPDKELLEQIEQLREILRNFNQNLLQIQAWGTRTKTRSRPAIEPQEGTMLKDPRMPTTPTGTSAMRGKLPLTSKWWKPLQGKLPR